MLQGIFLGIKIIENFVLQDRGSSIPQGDQEKCNYSTSTQQDSFRKPGFKDFTAFDREEAVNRLRRTTFQLGDRRVPGYLQTTAAESYPSRLMTGMNKHKKGFVSCVVSVTCPIL